MHTNFFNPLPSVTHPPHPMGTQRLLLFLCLFPMMLSFQLLGVFCGDHPAHCCMQADRETLLRFKQGLHDPSNRLSSWQSQDLNCCQWTGVGCDNRTGHVVKLDLRNPRPPFSLYGDDGFRWALGGEIHDALLGLKHLAYLDLSANKFTGETIPPFMGSLSQLWYLNLSRCGLSGKIPHQLGNLSRLQYLDLSDNFNYIHQLQNLYRSELMVDDAGWISHLSSLRHLNMGSVNFTGVMNWLTVINILPSISWVSLPWCQLEGFPSLSDHVNLTSLSFLDLSGNYIDSPFPKWLANITRLEYLDLSFNNLTGQTPPTMGSLSSLKVLDLSENNHLLEGGLPESLKYLCMLQRLEMSSVNTNIKFDELVARFFSGCIRSSLQYLDLSRAQLSGSLPDAWFGELKELKYLDLSDNSLNGSIPDSLGELSQLETLDMSSNLLEGSIPDSLGRLSSLKVLALGYNGLISVVPKSLGGLSQLERLYLSSNRLEGTITEAHFANLNHLEGLAMASNRLHFDISSSWVSPFRLAEVNMGSCRLGPHFPTWLRLNVYVHVLNFSATGISDLLPASYWSSTVRIIVLDLSNNDIKGKIPNSLRTINATIMVLRSNSIEGHLSTFGRRLRILDLSNNSFYGSIPRNILREMIALNISNNKLSGSIPSSLCQLTHLQALDLSSNNLSGELPTCWNNCKVLYSMNLAHNGLVISDISSTLTFPSSLQFLHLNNNFFSGKLPASLSNCTHLFVLDLGDNKFSRNIPSWMASMPSLQVLRLRSNMFTGNIPTNLSTLASLQVIDLAYN